MSLKQIFLIQAIIEIVAGFLLISNLNILFLIGEMDQNAVSLARMYAIAALVLGGLSLQFYKYFEHTPLFKMSSLLFMIFHMAIGFHLCSLYSLGSVSNIGPGSFHILFAIVFAIVYYRESDKFL